MTGITRVSKESIFSDVNHMEPYHLFICQQEEGFLLAIIRQIRRHLFQMKRSGRNCMQRRDQIILQKIVSEIDVGLQLMGDTHLG